MNKSVFNFLQIVLGIILSATFTVYQLSINYKIADYLTKILPTKDEDRIFLYLFFIINIVVPLIFLIFKTRLKVFLVTYIVVSISIFLYVMWDLSNFKLP